MNEKKEVMAISLPDIASQMMDHMTNNIPPSLSTIDRIGDEDEVLRILLRMVKEIRDGLCREMIEQRKSIEEIIESAKESGNKFREMLGEDPHPVPNSDDWISTGRPEPH